MRVVGKSGVVQDLPDRLAKSLLREGVVERVVDPPKDKPRSAAPEQAPEAAEAEADKPKPRRPRKPKTDE